jgi:hypothetical protein
VLTPGELTRRYIAGERVSINGLVQREPHPFVA